LLVLLVGVGAGWMALQTDADDPDRRGLVVGVVDGDTVDVRVLATRERVRVLGIDAPETGSCLSRQATAETNRLTLGRLVKLQGDPSQPERDRFDRLLAYVELPGERDLGLELVKRGLARVFVVGRPFMRVESYRKAESLGRPEPEHLELLVTGEPLVPPWGPLLAGGGLLRGDSGAGDSWRGL